MSAEQLSARAIPAGRNVEHVVMEAVARAAVSWLVSWLSRVGIPLPWVITIAMAMMVAGCVTSGGVKAPVSQMSGAPAQPLQTPEVSAPPTQPPKTPEMSGPPTPSPKTPPLRGATSTASWYGMAHNGRPTASGEIYDMNDLTAAHRSLPLGTRVLVTNLKNWPLRRGARQRPRPG